MEHKRTALITGATSGIGRATAMELARRGWSLWLIGRHVSRGKRVVRAIERMDTCAHAQFVAADISSFKEVRSLAARVQSETTKIDALINNAGARFLQLGRSVDGIERTFATNHLGHFLLSLLLIEHLAKSDDGRIINVASSAHHAGKGEFEAVLKADPYDGRQAYAESKLANLLFTHELSRRLEGAGVTVNAVDPGGVATRFSLNNGLMAWARHLVYYLKERSLLLPRQACQTLVYLASASELEGVTGRYFAEKREIGPSARALDQKLAKRLWTLSCELTGVSREAVVG